MRHREANRHRLVRHNVHILVASGRAVDGQEAQVVAGAGDVGALHNEGFGVFLILDLPDPGGGVGVADAEGL